MAQRALAIAVLVVVCVTSAHDQTPSLKDELANLERLASRAHDAGRVDDEISLRQQVFTKTWTDEGQSKSLSKYYRYDIVSLNDLTLAVLLEGTHHLLGGHLKAAIDYHFKSGQREKA